MGNDQWETNAKEWRQLVKDIKERNPNMSDESVHDVARRVLASKGRDQMSCRWL